jgi:hypothetical protein
MIRRTLGAAGAAGERWLVLDAPKRGKLGGLALACALLAAACGSPATATPAAVTPSPTDDPRHDELDQAQATWQARRPTTVAYTTTRDIGGGAQSVVRVTEMDNRTEALILSAGDVPPDDGGRSLSIDGVFDLAHEGLDGDGRFEYTVDRLLGYLPRIDYSTDAAGASFTIEVSDLTTRSTGSATPTGRPPLPVPTVHRQAGCRRRRRSRGRSRPRSR